MEHCPRMARTWAAIALVWCAHGARINVQTNESVAGSLTTFASGCTPASSSTFCSGDGWQYSQGQCCKTGAYITCQKGVQTFCNGNWKYMGNSNCCTTEWAACDKGSQSFCSEDGFQYLGNELCCVTSSSEVWLTCQEGVQAFCRGPGWKYVGNSKCCSTNWVSCTEGSQSFCSGTNFQYIGNGQCCVSGAAWNVKPTCNQGSQSYCQGDWKYVGKDTCCSPQKATCSGGYSQPKCQSESGQFLGREQCCWSTY